MGANEKYEAAMHGAKFTPDADAVESAYVQHRSHQVTLIEAHHEFNRAIEKIKAEAKAEALNEAADQVSNIDGREDHAARDWLRAHAEQIRERLLS